MASRKRNEYLEIEDSDEAEQNDYGYDSEAAEESKTRTRASKRRKVLDVDHEQFAASDDEEGDGDDRSSRALSDTGDSKHNEDNDHNIQEEEQEKDGSTSSDKYDQREENKPKKPLTDKTKLKPPKKDKSGVVYMSSLPPYLKPAALKTMLIQRGFGPVTRVFLTPSVRSTSHSGSGSRRSNKRKTYADGWVEFASKKTAKVAAETLCAQPIGGKKGGFYHDDIWNMKYLKGFKWADLMETVNRERSEREARQRVEDARARKEDKVFLAGVEKGKIVEGIRKKREGKKNSNANTGASDESETAASKLQVRRVFRQNEVKLQKTGGQDLGSIGEDAKRVLGKIF